MSLSLYHNDSSDENVAYLTLIGDFKKNDTFFYFGYSIIVFLTLFISDDYDDAPAFCLSKLIIFFFPLFFPIYFLSLSALLLLLITALAIFVSLLYNR